MMKNPPIVLNTSHECVITVSWSGWSTEKDIGNGPVAAYLVQVVHMCLFWTKAIIK